MTGSLRHKGKLAHNFCRHLPQTLTATVTAAPRWTVQGTDQVAHDQTESLIVEHFNTLHIITRE